MDSAVRIIMATTSVLVLAHMFCRLFTFLLNSKRKNRFRRLIKNPQETKY